MTTDAEVDVDRRQQAGEHVLSVQVNNGGVRTMTAKELAESQKGPGDPSAANSAMPSARSAGSREAWATRRANAAKPKPDEQPASGKLTVAQVNEIRRLGLELALAQHDAMTAEAQ